MQTNIWTYYKHVVAFVPKSWEKERGRQMLNIFRTTYLCSEGKMLLQIRLMLLCNKKFNVQIQPFLSKIKHVFLFLCSVVTGLPTTTKAPPPSQKWVRGKQVGGGAHIPCEWKLTLNDHSTIEETVALYSRGFNRRQMRKESWKWRLVKSFST